MADVTFRLATLGFTSTMVGALHRVMVYVFESVPHVLVAVTIRVVKPSLKFTFWLMNPLFALIPLTIFPFFVTCNVVLASKPPMLTVINTEALSVVLPEGMLPEICTSGALQLLKETLVFSMSEPQLFMTDKTKAFDPGCNVTLAVSIPLFSS